MPQANGSNGCTTRAGSKRSPQAGCSAAVLLSSDPNLGLLDRQAQLGPERVSHEPLGTRLRPHPRGVGVKPRRWAAPPPDGGALGVAPPPPAHQRFLGGLDPHAAPL